MASAVQPSRRRGSSKSEPMEEAIMIIQPSDLRQVTVLRKAELQRIQDRPSRLKKEKERVREAAEQREALHQQSKEVVKLWSNTITGQRQKKLEAKMIREQIEEEKRKLMDIEEAKYKEQKQKEIIERAKTQQYYQTDRVKGLHRALLLTEVLKERDAQVELKQRQKSATKDADKEYVEMVKSREDEALRQEQEKAKQKKLQRQAAEEDLKNQMKENEKVREQLKLEDKKDGEEIQRLLEQYQLEQRMESGRQANERKNLMLAQMEQRHNRDLLRAINAQKQEAEEEQRKLFLSAKQKMIKLRNEKEKELFREAQMRRERIMGKLTVKQQEEAVSEEQRIAKAVAEQDAKQAQEQQEKEEKKAEMLKSIAAHRESMRREKEQMEKTAKQNKQDTLQRIKEADKIFSEEQQLEAKKTRENEIKLQDFNVTLMAEKSARQQRLKEEEHEFDAKNAEFMAEEENKFQQYSQSIINAAAVAQKNLFPLCKAAREGIGGGQGPVFGRFRPSYLVQDRTGAQMPKYVSGTTEDIKKRNEVVDIQEAKRRLGFTW
ncbi:cilia- and flagella- associated protein 210 isoform X2 [Amphiprion ocellaris]|uniref:Trichohyalin-plectin-homology domain-containing protein n=1 Tax=Amphiprion ocellaris TaxID=80972 RepID=A0A3Q1CPH2_AMPOC|nr:cilia- and flagella- associated protein 210 isoform X2 [Amphiprion ocellaris]